MLATHLGHYNTSSTRTHVRFQFSTHAAAGGNVAPNSAFEAADIRIYKAADGAAFSATQRSSANGITMTSPFDTLTGFHDVDIDLTDNTDAGFYAAGSFYSVVLAPDETVDSQTLTGVVLAYFEIGVAKADVTQFGGTAGAFNSGVPDVRLADGVAHGGTVGSSTATLALSRVNVTSQTSNTNAITATGNGTGHGIAATSGSGATGNGLTLLAASTNGHGLKSTGTGTGDGAELTAGASGADLDADTTGNITGNLSGSAGSVTGAVGSVTGNVGGNVSGSVGSVTGNVGGNVTGSIGSLATQAKADVNAEADTALADAGVTTTVTGRIDAAISTRLASASYTAPLDAAGVRSAVGLASANLDTQLAAIAGYIDTEVAAIISSIAALNNISTADVLTQVNAALQATLADSVPADGTRPSISSGIYMLVQFMLERSVSGTTCTVRKPDGSTSLFTLTLNDATSPTSITRAS